MYPQLKRRLGLFDGVRKVQEVLINVRFRKLAVFLHLIPVEKCTASEQSFNKRTSTFFFSNLNEPFLLLKHQDQWLLLRYLLFMTFNSRLQLQITSNLKILIKLLNPASILISKLNIISFLYNFYLSIYPFDFFLLSVSLLASQLARGYS